MEITTESKNTKAPKAAIIATGWIGDTIACTAAATSLSEKGYQVSFFTRWPQLVPILKNDERYRTVNYFHLNILKVLNPFINSTHELIVKSPERWNYLEPHTSEIRRIANCPIHPSYELIWNDHPTSNSPVSHCDKPLISISKDLYKRLYGRDGEEFISMLSEVARIQWIGLDAHKSSKYGKHASLIPVVKQLLNSDFYLGPEGGMLWLAAGLGMKTIYFTEHILVFEDKYGLTNLREVLGSKNCFPQSNRHYDIPPHCSNIEAMNYICQAISEHIKE